MPSATPQEPQKGQQNAGSGKARVVHGVFNEPIAAGSSIKDARAKLLAVGSSTDDTQAYINNQKVTDEAIIPEGASVTFMKRSGEKG